MVKKLLIINSDNSLSLTDLSGNSNGEQQRRQLNIVTLNHPKSQEPTPFLYVNKLSKNSDDDDLYELVSYSPDFASLFLDDYVQSECAVHFATKFNAVYFLIEFLQANAASQSFESMADLKRRLADSLRETQNNKREQEAVPLRLRFCDLTQLAALFDVTSAHRNEPNKPFRLQFNATKCVAWLKSKVQLIATKLEANAASQSSAAKATKAAAASQEAKDKLLTKLTTEAFEVIAQYIRPSLADQLRKELHLAAPLDSSSNSSVTPLANSATKRAKQEVKVK